MFSSGPFGFLWSLLVFSFGSISIYAVIFGGEVLGATKTGCTLPFVPRNEITWPANGAKTVKQMANTTFFEYMNKQKKEWRE